MCTGLGFVFSGKKTKLEVNPELPRLPMFPNQMIERTWIAYFREMHRIVEKHLTDYQMHKVK